MAVAETEERVEDRPLRSLVRPSHQATAPRKLLPRGARTPKYSAPSPPGRRSEEHTSELQSQSNLVCRLLLEKKKTRKAPGGAYITLVHTLGSPFYPRTVL